MKNSTTIVVSLLALLLIGGGIIFLVNDQSNSSDSAITGSSNTSSEPAPTPPPSTDNATAGNQQYVAYSDDYLETTSGTRLLFFHAPWCPQCRALEADILDSELPEDVTIVKVDYDSSQDLKQKYGVTLQTTVVKVDNQGNLVDSYTPYDEPTFDNVAANLL